MDSKARMLGRDKKYIKGDTSVGGKELKNKRKLRGSVLKQVAKLYQAYKFFFLFLLRQYAIKPKDVMS
jgi:hypothetical protein